MLLRHQRCPLGASEPPDVGDGGAEGEPGDEEDDGEDDGDGAGVHLKEESKHRNRISDSSRFLLGRRRVRRTSKIAESIFRPALPARGLSIRILWFG
jgi:hypothetical protein